MKRKLQLEKFIVYGLLLFAVAACKKAEQFYNTLQTLPQIDNSRQFAYNAAYIIGDTMVITGRLQPQNNLQVIIGGVNAQIVKTASVQYNKGDNTFAQQDQVSLLISPDMEGRAREVNVISGGYSTAGNPIDVYSAGGPGSFADSLKAVTVKMLTNNQVAMLYCRSGKGDVYYYAASSKEIRHVSKDGTEEVAYDLSKGLPDGTNLTVNNFLAGGIDPQQQSMYFSVVTSQGYRFCKFGLRSKQLSILNRSISFGAPYEGAIDQVRSMITGVYPDSKGNLYLGIGLGNVANVNQLRDLKSFPDAIAKYTPADGNLSYMFKLSTASQYAGMPGVSLPFRILSMSYSPDEQLLYLTEGNAGVNYTVMELYDLASSSLVESQVIVPGTTMYQAIGPFSGLTIDLGFLGATTANSFGYLPMPGKRLQTLLYQYIAGSGRNVAASRGFPKWIVFDFNEERTYGYALGRFNLDTYTFEPLMGGNTAKDELLNTDEDGHLYMTANGKTRIVKTQTIN